MFGLGVKGAAYATVLGQAVISPVIIWQLFKSESVLKLDRESIRLEKIGLKKLIKIATPSASSQALSAFGF